MLTICYDYDDEDYFINVSQISIKGVISSIAPSGPNLANIALVHMELYYFFIWNYTTFSKSCDLIMMLFVQFKLVFFFYNIICTKHENQ